MRTLAQKPKTTQPTTSAKSSPLSRSHVVQGHDPNSILNLQRAIGNQALLRLLQSNAEERNAVLPHTSLPHLGHDFARIPISAPQTSVLQTKLPINKPGDEHEQEADRISEQVMRMPEPQFQRACACGGVCTKCQTDQVHPPHELLQTKRVQARDVGQDPLPPAVHESLQSPGQPLDPGTRTFVEPRFGHDFSQIRIHADGDSAASAWKVGARQQRPHLQEASLAAVTTPEPAGPNARTDEQEFFIEGVTTGLPRVDQGDETALAFAERGAASSRGAEPGVAAAPSEAESAESFELGLPPVGDWGNTAGQRPSRQGWESSRSSGSGTVVARHQQTPVPVPAAEMEHHLGNVGVSAEEKAADRAEAAIAAGKGVASAASSAATPWIAGGSPLPAVQRAALERAFGAALGNVRTFEGPAARKVADRFGARAVTYGPHVFMGAGEGTSDRGLLAHEVAHTLQQAEGTAHPAAKPAGVGKPLGEYNFEEKLKRIQSNLSYGFLDWAITDAEAIESLELLESMTGFERVTAMSHIDVGRLRDNLPAQHRPRLELIERETEPAVADTRKIDELLSYEVLDWAITDAEAARALDLLEKMPPRQRMHALMGINRRRLAENLPTEEQRMHLAELWTEAHAAWNRGRQQIDPLNPGDALKITVYNALGQEEEKEWSFKEYVVDAEYNISVPWLEKVNVRNLGAAHIEARLTDILKPGYLRAPIVSVEVTRRAGELFEPEGLAISEDQPPPSTKLAPGDTFEMRVLDTATWTEESDISGNFQIDAGGSVKLKHLGLVNAAGKTVSELEAHMLERLEGWYKAAPTIWIFVTSCGGQIYRPHAAARPRPIKSHSIEASIAEMKARPLPERREIDVWLDFVRGKQAEIAKLGTREALFEHEVLRRFMDWLSANNNDAKLAATNPWEVWGRIHTPMLIAKIKTESREKVLAESEERARTERSAAVEKKLDEYWAWAMGRWKEAGVVFRSVGRAYLLTESPLRKTGMNTLTSAVLSWAYANTVDPDFLKKSPDEVAEYLLAKDPYLFKVVELGKAATPRLEYFPELDRTRYTLGEIATETIVGFIPVIGDVIDAMSALEGTTITGHEMETGDRVLTAIGAIIPFVPGSALRTGKNLPEVVEKVAVQTGRNADEIYAIFRVAGHLDAGDVKDLERVIGLVKDGKHLSPADMKVLDNIALKLKNPLEEAAGLLAKGKEIPIGKLRADIVTGTKFIPGTAEHKAQRWIEYQFRNPGAHPKISGAIDPAWEKAYDTIARNYKTGSKFEGDALAWLGKEKNTALMMPPAGKGAGFIPDSVAGNPAELIWGQPYHFTEIKGWQNMSDTGNLSAMLKYVEDYGGHIEAVFRSGKHADGPTKLTTPLLDRLKKLIKDGKATIKEFPP